MVCGCPGDVDFIYCLGLVAERAARGFGFGHCRGFSGSDQSGLGFGYLSDCGLRDLGAARVKVKFRRFGERARVVRAARGAVGTGGDTQSHPAGSR